MGTNKKQNKIIKIFFGTKNKQGKLYFGFREVKFCT